jgi:predicted nucleotidyltransferase
MEIEILHPEIVEMLVVFESVLRKLYVDFYLVGAIARDIHLARDNSFAAKRKTNDVDIAVMLADEEQLLAIKAALIATGYFTEHATEAIKVFYKEAIELDLLPFGDIENAERETHLNKPKLFVMDVPGFKELLPYSEEIKIDNTVLHVCPLEGLIILKLLANDDRPDRTKDITDIEHLISIYFYLNSEEIWSNYNDITEIYGGSSPLTSNYLQLVSARIIGRKMKKMLSASEKLIERVKGILQKRASEFWQAMYDGMDDN